MGPTRKQQDPSKKNVELSKPKINSEKKETLTADLEGAEALPEGAMDDSTKNTTLDVVEKDSVNKDPPIPVVIGLQCNVFSRSKRTKQVASETPPNTAQTEKQQLGGPSTPEPEANVEGKEADADTIPRRKRGRPPKSQAENPTTPVADPVQGAIVVRSSKRNAGGSTISVGTEPGNENPVLEKEQLQLTESYNSPRKKNVSESQMEDTIVLDADKLLSKLNKKTPPVHHKYKLVKGKRGKRRAISSINIESSAKDGQDSSKQIANGGLEKDPAAGNPEHPVEKSLDTVSDDQPLSRWFEGMHSSVTVDSTVPAPEKRVEQSLEAGKKQLDTVKSYPDVNGGGMVVNGGEVVVNGGEMVEGDGQSLSFVKCSPLWQAIESMELFRKIPQTPHFRPLNCLKESAREGQAISQMVNFSKVVENTSQLRIEDPRTAIEDYLETLVELESHGFDVKVIRDRLLMLLSMKEKQEELEGRWKEVAEKTKAKSVEGKKIGEELEAMDEQIRELLEKRWRVMAEKEKKNAEVAVLEAEINGIKECMNEARLEFDGLAAASW